jgi:dihydroxyacid dehydratase/phosphogluconate dehydratase
MPSRHVTEGPFAAPQRAFYYAMGLEAADIHRPLVGVVSAWDGRAAAADAPLLAGEAVEGGVTSGGATARRFATISDDGDGSLLARELVADSVELAVRGHSYDALVGIASTASAMAGLLMVACRLDIPAVLVPVVSPAFGATADAVAFAAAAVAAGLALEPGGESARAAGLRVAELLGEGRTARAAITAESLRRAATALTAAGGPPDAAVHLVAIGRECGLDVDVEALVPALAAGRRDVAWVRGTLVPAGALASGASGPVRACARVFESAEAAGDWLGDPETAVVVRFQGPRGAPGAPCLHALAGARCALLVTDGRLPDSVAVPAVALAAPEAALGGPLARLRDGDVVILDPGAGRLDADGLEGREPARPPARTLPRTWAKYAQLVEPGNEGAVTHPGAAGEVIRYADL